MAVTGRTRISPDWSPHPAPTTSATSFRPPGIAKRGRGNAARQPVNRSLAGLPDGHPVVNALHAFYVTDKFGDQVDFCGVIGLAT